MSKETRFGINDVLADLAKRRINRKNQENDSISSEDDSHNDDSDIDGNYCPSSNSSSDSHNEISNEQLHDDLNNEETEVALNLEVVTEPNEPAVKRKRNKIAKPEEWKKNKLRDARMAGLEYKTYRGATVSAKKPKAQGARGVRDCSKCRLKCLSKISEVQRESLCKTYYGLKASLCLCYCLQ